MSLSSIRTISNTAPAGGAAGISTRERRALALFFVLAYLFSWMVWGAEIAEAQGRTTLHVPEAFAFIGLSVAAVIAALYSSGLAGIGDLVWRWFRWRVHPVWCVVALLLPALLGMIAIVLYWLLGGSHTIGADVPLSAAAMFFLTHFPLYVVTEETAWRGFALPRMQSGYSALVSSLVLGVIWGFWHTPLFFKPGSFQSTLPLAAFVIATVATTILHTWLFNYTKGSVLLAGIFHGASNATIIYLGVMSGASSLLWLYVAVLCVSALLVVVVEGPVHLSRKRDLYGTVYPP